MKKKKFLDRFRAAFKNRDEAEFEKVIEESVKDAEGEETEEEKKKREAEEAAKTSDTLRKVADALTELTNRVAALETKDEESETEEEKKKREAEEAAAKTSDSAALLAQVQDVRTRVEILSPGMQFPTFDAAADPKKTRDGLCALRRKALEAAYNGKNRDAVVPFVGVNPDFAKLTCDGLNAAFIGASEIVRRDNNAQAKVTFDSGKSAASIASTISDMNRRAAEFWSRK